MRAIGPADDLFPADFPRLARSGAACRVTGDRPMTMHIETFATGPLGCNCSIVMDPASKHAVVVDPGGDLDKIQGRLTALGAKVDAIVHTHTHIDHVGATPGIPSLSSRTLNSDAYAMLVASYLIASRGMPTFWHVDCLAERLMATLPSSGGQDR